MFLFHRFKPKLCSFFLVTLFSCLFLAIAISASAMNKPFMRGYEANTTKIAGDEVNIGKIVVFYKIQKVLPGLADVGSIQPSTLVQGKDLLYDTRATINAFYQNKGFN